MERAVAGSVRPTTLARLDAGPVEYRLDRRGDATVLLFHGGHMRAGLALGEDVFAEAGYTVLVPSRPGYGRTPLRTGRSPGGFADVTQDLCRHLDIDQVAAVVGTSAGGPTAMAMAARHPKLIQRLLLQSSVGFVPWPDLPTRLMAYAGFNGATERATWAAVRALMRYAPTVGFQALLGDLSSRPAQVVLASLGASNRETLRALFSGMRSGRGFLNDLRWPVDVADITQPTLVIATRHDGSVSFTHAESVVAHIPHAELIVSQADSHFIWFTSDYPRITDKIRHFLAY